MSIHNTGPSIIGTQIRRYGIVVMVVHLRGSFTNIQQYQEQWVINRWHCWPSRGNAVSQDTKENTFRNLKGLPLVQKLRCRLGFHRWTVWEHQRPADIFTGRTHITCSCADCNMLRVEMPFSSSLGRDSNPPFWGYYERTQEFSRSITPESKLA